MSFQDAQRRVIKSYREWLRSVMIPLYDLRATSDTIEAPEIQQMYSLNMPVSALRTKMRQEFERHRFVRQLPVVDMLITQSHMEFQV